MSVRAPSLGRTHRNAVDRTGRQAQLATRALRFDHSVHELVCADDGVDGAGRAAVGTSDAQGFINYRNGGRRRTGCKRGYLVAAEQVGEAPHRVIAAGRTEIDCFPVFDDRCGIGPASRVSALRALGLR